jgi:hypothetical protein
MLIELLSDDQMQQLLKHSQDARYLVITIMGLMRDPGLTFASRATLTELDEAKGSLWPRIVACEQIPPQDWEPFDRAVGHVRTSARDRRQRFSAL